MSQELRNNFVFGLMVEDDRRTRVVSTLCADVAAVAKAVRETGKGGEITLKIKVTKNKSDEEALDIKYDVTSKVPGPDVRSSVAFFDEKTKTVIKTDPRQLEMLAEKEDERRAQAERDRQVSEAGLARIGRGTETATA